MASRKKSTKTQGAKAPGDAAAPAMVGIETVRDFNRRLNLEGRYDEMLADAKAEVARAKAAGRPISFDDARNLVAEKYGAKCVMPKGAAKGYPEADLPYLETLDWVCQALGKMRERLPVTRLDAPGPKAWALYEWAKTDDRTQKEFFAMWTTACKRSEEAKQEGRAEVKRQDAELEAMLDEIEEDSAAMLKDLRGEDGTIDAG